MSTATIDATNTADYLSEMLRILQQEMGQGDFIVPSVTAPLEVLDGNSISQLAGLAICKLGNKHPITQELRQTLAQGHIFNTNAALKRAIDALLENYDDYDELQAQMGELHKEHGFDQIYGHVAKVLDEHMIEPFENPSLAETSELERAVGIAKQVLGRNNGKKKG